MRKKIVMLAHKYTDSFFKSIGETKLFFCFPMFSFGTKHLCSAQVFLTPWILPLPISAEDHSPLKPGSHEM